MTLFSKFLLSTSLFLLIASSGQAAAHLGGRMQMIGFSQKVDDPYKSDLRVFMFMKQARLTFANDFDAMRFRAEMAVAGEEEVKAPSPGVSLGMLDFYFEVPFWATHQIRIGQFKVPYGAERLKEDGSLRFIDRSIHDLAFRIGRDVGFAWITDNASLGLFAGGGRDIPERYLPEDLGIPLIVARLKANDSVHLNGAYMRDSLIGHSSVLNVKMSEKSLLINPYWNPFLAQAPLAKGAFWQMGVDSSWSNFELEINYGGYANTYGFLNLFGGRMEAWVSQPPFDLAMRYAIVIPSDKFAYAQIPITGASPIHEITIAATHHLSDAEKIIVDFPILIGAPVAIESGAGAYVLTEQPDQASVLKTAGNTVNRQTIIEARALYQIRF